MPAEMKFIVLDVGQGTGNYIEVYDGLGSVRTILIDLGSEGWKTAAGKPSADLVAEMLKKITPPTLNCVFLSHSDSDHINLLIYLLEKFDSPRTQNPNKPVLTVHRVVYGGDRSLYKKSNKDYLKELDKYRPLPLNSPSILEPVDDDATSFSGIDHDDWEPMTELFDCEVWLLIGNTVSETVPVYQESETGRKANDGYAINTRSLVLIVRYAGNQFVVTGDATGMTLANANVQLQDHDVQGYVGNVFDLTLPHHGSDTTTYDLLGASDDAMDAEELAEANVKEFVDYVQPQTISASAGQRSTYRHPSYRVLDDFGTHLTDDVYFVDDALTASREHFYTAYFASRAKKLNVSPGSWPSKAGWYTARTAANRFSTDYYWAGQHTLDYVVTPPAPATANTIKKFAPQPPRGVAWGMFLDAQGNRQILKASTRAALAALPREQVERMLGGPLPEDEEFVWIPSAHLVDKPPGEPPPADREPPVAAPDDDSAPPARAVPRPLLPGLRQVP